MDIAYYRHWGIDFDHIILLVEQLFDFWADQLYSYLVKYLSFFRFVKVFVNIKSKFVLNLCCVKTCFAFHF